MSEYQAQVRWSGSTAQGWERYAREHAASAPPARQEVRLTTGEAKGDPSVLNPEQLVLMAASSCQLLWFLHLAAKSRIVVLYYEDAPSAEMPADEGWLARIVLRPRITLAADTSEARVRKLCELAHEHCNVAKTLRSEIVLEPEIRAG